MTRASSVICRNAVPPARLRTRPPRPGAAARRRAWPSDRSRAGLARARPAGRRMFAWCEPNVPRPGSAMPSFSILILSGSPSARSPRIRASCEPRSRISAARLVAGEPFRRTRFAEPVAMAQGLPSLCGRPSSPAKMRLESRAPPCFLHAREADLRGHVKTAPARWARSPGPGRRRCFQ